jgi:hypothetical protein
MSKKNHLYIIFVICYCQITYTQNHEIYLEVDTNIVKTNWHKNYLNSSVFTNGERIFDAIDLEDWRDSVKRHNPRFFVTKDAFFYYNYNAVTNFQGLCPNFYRLPDSADFFNYKMDFMPIGMLDYDPNTDILKIREPSLNNVIFLPFVQTQRGSQYFNVAMIEKNGKISHWLLSREFTGVPVRCITDLGAIIQDSVFEYKQLVWGQYTAALNDMLHASVDYFEIGKPFKIQLAGTIEAKRNTAQNFRIKSSDFTISGKTKNLTHLLIEERLLEALRVKIPLPMYKGTSLLAQSNFNLTLKREILKTPEQRFYTNQVMRSSVALSDVHINYANVHGFRVKTYKEVISMAEGAQTLYSKADLKVSSFHSRGSIYSLAAVLPGLGLKTINRIQYKESGTKPQEKLSKTFLISSISLGTIGVASKIYSEIQYKKYRDNPFGISEQRNYEMANLSNQIFISSLLGYGILSILDFSISFGIGVKNKTTQAQLNRQLKKEGHLSLKSDFSKELITPPRLSPSTTHSSDQLPIRGTFMDSRDGKNYKTVVIGTQTWMAENLAYKPKKGNYWAYDNNIVNVKQYGYLYDWQRACEVCPAGWRLPTEDDWKLLLQNLKKDQIKSDFSALPGGYYNYAGWFFSIGSFGNWWSSKQPVSNWGTAFFVNHVTNESNIGSYPMQNGFSVRCIKN